MTAQFITSEKTKSEFLISGQSCALVWKAYLKLKSWTDSSEVISQYFWHSLQEKNQYNYFFHNNFGEFQSTYRKVASSRLSRLVARPSIFRMFMKGKFDAYLCTVTFGQKFPKLNSRPFYCSQLYGKYFETHQNCYDRHKAFAMYVHTVKFYKKYH